VQNGESRVRIPFGSALRRKVYSGDMGNRSFRRHR
jgi:hypothetical protein